jgi:antitoxin MazE
MAMIVSKWGDSLGARLSAEDVARLGLKEGDEVDVEIKRPEPRVSSEDLPDLSPEEWLMRMRQLRGRIPANFKFDRDEANAR